jgi:hypothetical protein
VPKVVLNVSPHFSSEYHNLTYLEGRHRKVRCIWNDERARSCQNCEIRGRSCVPQIYGTSVSDTVRLTAGERLKGLENSVTSLWTTVRQLEDKIGVDTSHQSIPEEARIQPDLDIESDSDVSDLSPLHPPNHLQQLFQNELLHSPDSSWRIQQRETSNKSVSMINRAREALQPLLPSIQDVAVIAQHASTWLMVLKSLFPFVYMFDTGSDMLTHLEEMKATKADPVSIANLLLSIALTIQQMPSAAIRENLSSIKDGSVYVKQVSDTVEEFIIAKDAFLSTLEGIETALQFIRL